MLLPVVELLDWLPVFALVELDEVWLPVVELVELESDWSPVDVLLSMLSVERPLGTRTIVIPIGNHDNNQHSYDENLRVQNLWDGIELMSALLTM